MMAAIQTWWSVVLLIVFVAMIAWAFWPRQSHKRKLEGHGQIPLRDDDPAEER
jgi:cbb3-type cytochrome oxidase subunit 3